MRYGIRSLAAISMLAIAAATSAQFLRKADPRNGAPLVEVLDVGQGDSILIRSPEGKVALIDAGPSKDVVSLLKRKGVTSIDIVFVTHHHADHYGGMSEVIKAFHPRYFVTTNSSHTTAAYLRLLRLVKEEGIQLIQPKATARRVEIGSIVLRIFPQPPPNAKEENDNSIGMRLEYGSFSMLLTGDSEEDERHWWVKNNPEMLRDCTVLKLAHHGSRNGTDASWLSLVKPKLTVASLGKDNEYHHPHPETVSLLKREGIPFLRTDQAGTVAIYTDGKTWRVNGVPQAVAARTTQESAGAEEPEPVPEKRRAPWRSSKTQARTDSRINLNTASQQELETLPGVGEVTAQKIMKARPFDSVDDLTRVRGISESRLAKIRDEVVVR
jgi:competence protein ComEC